MRILGRFAPPSFIAGALVSVFTCPVPAGAEDTLQFSSDPRTSAVYARGKIDNGASARLEQFLDATGASAGRTIYFHSPGGSLGEGMKLGQVLRGRQLNTSIRAENSDIGECLSACAVAFVGGVSRTIPPGSRYGVHRFRYSHGSQSNSSSEQVEAAQVASALLIKYFALMGVDPELFTAAALTSATKMSYPSAEMLQKWRVTTGPTQAAQWSIDESGGTVYLRGQEQRGANLATIAIGCTQEALFLFGYFDGDQVAPGPSADVLMLGSERLLIEGLRAQEQRSGRTLVVTYRLPSIYWQKFRTAPSIGISVAPRQPNTARIANLVSFSEARPEFEAFARRCFPLTAK